MKKLKETNLFKQLPDGTFAVYGIPDYFLRHVLPEFDWSGERASVMLSPTDTYALYKALKDYYEPFDLGELPPPNLSST